MHSSEMDPTEERRVIHLGDKRNLIEQKLAQYQKRFDPFKEPDTQLDTLYKMAICQELLKTEKVDVDSFTAVLSEKHKLDPEVYISALAVIEDYVQTGGANLNKPHIPKS